PDPISKIEQANIPNFEGMLASNEDHSKWMIAYNNAVSSQGRIRFTKAHELGHYILHRHTQQNFMCTGRICWLGQAGQTSKLKLIHLLRAY
ncbi:ImmA/IrrE family metallo-endopeptidase, partial [Pseudoalteromonas sp. GABNS16G]|uniref:ImmA/IrrE family metallo-endopeptidase n=1 Tax=Pseudoalteromonas sp. GABNS16G TaxID=3025324 RepID=UPI0023583DED